MLTIDRFLGTVNFELCTKYFNYSLQFNVLRMLETDASSYVMRLDGGTAMSHYEQREAWARTREGLRSALHAYGSRVTYDESQGSASTTSQPYESQYHPTRPGSNISHFLFHALAFNRYTYIKTNLCRVRSPDATAAVLQPIRATATPATSVHR